MDHLFLFFKDLINAHPHTLIILFNIALFMSLAWSVVKFRKYTETLSSALNTVINTLDTLNKEHATFHHGTPPPDPVDPTPTPDTKGGNSMGNKKIIKPAKPTKDNRKPVMPKGATTPKQKAPKPRCS